MGCKAFEEMDEILRYLAGGPLEEDYIKIEPHPEIPPLRSKPVPEAVYSAALRKWGAVHQSRIAQEEFAEAITAISHYMRGRDGADDELVEELVDVEIMLGQMKLLVSQESYRRVFEKKLKSLIRRIDDASE